jgi:hypothetical protein
MAKKVRGKPFVKGQPGGPGRPKGGHLEWCREFATTEGFEILKKWARCKQGKVSMQAVTLILAYGFGKPQERVEHSGSINFSEFVETQRKERGLHD